ncbi:MAG: hypothetical protein JXB46_06785 [Candidatus Eisenbacteria bacterium]|nr:hypothetical protein [Candidatus Eisenbacteria bacterium]
MSTLRRASGSAGTAAVLASLVALALIAGLARAQTPPTQKQGELKQDTPSAKAAAKVQAKASARVDIEGEPAVEKKPEPYNVLANTDETTRMALAGWSSKYRVGLRVSDGDWVKYEVSKGPVKEIVELRSTRTEDGDTWLIEKHTAEGAEASFELHLRFAKGKPRLMAAFRVNQQGEIEHLTVPDEMTAAELVVATRDAAIDALGGDRGAMRVIDHTEAEELTGPFGTLQCRLLEVRVAEKLSPVSLTRMRPWLPEGTQLWLSEDVPRLIPMDPILLPALLSPDDTMMVQGGLVRAPGYELIDYSGRAE